MDLRVCLQWILKPHCLRRQSWIRTHWSIFCHTIAPSGIWGYQKSLLTIVSKPCNHYWLLGQEILACLLKIEYSWLDSWCRLNTASDLGVFSMKTFKRSWWECYGPTSLSMERSVTTNKSQSICVLHKMKRKNFSWNAGDSWMTGLFLDHRVLITFPSFK